MSSNSKLTAPLSTQEKRALLAKALRKRVAAPKSYPASFAQRRLWFLYHLEPDSPLYNIAAAIRLNGRLDVHALRQALGEVVRRHDALRTTFALADGSPVQVVSPTLELPVPLTDLCTLPADAREGEVARRARAEAETPFDLGAGPLLRVGLLAFGACEHVMLLTMHHIVSDAWSMDVLVRELTTLYKAFCEGAPSPLPELPIQYADYARWQHKWLTGEVLERQMDYWKRQLRAAPVMALPTDRPRPLVRSSRGGHHAFHLPPPLAEAIRALGAAHNATPFMTLLAAFTSLLHRYTQQEEVVVGCPIAGRNRKETEGLIGFFVNTLVLRVDAVGDPTFGELLARVRETALGAYAHQDLPFEMLVEKLQPERRLGHTPLFQVAFVMQSRDESAAAAVDGLTFGSVPVENNFAKFDLTLAIAETQRGLRASFEYSTELYDAETVARMAGHLRVLLEGAVSNPGCRLSELPLLTEAERLRLPAVRNAHAAARPQAKCLPELFAEQARRTPGAVAVVDERTQLTYAQLDARADRLAHRLRTLGVAPDTLVALCLERSCLMVVALLAVLKAGGAYLPLDPNYPPDRLSFMLEDAAAPVLLTQAALAGSLPAYAGHVLSLDAEEEAGAGGGGAPGCEAGPENLAYVIYTSGSTGRPKGVMVTHRNVTRLFDATREQFLFDESDTWTLFHSYAFDFSVWELWGALLYGGRLVVVPYMISRTPELFYELLKEQRVTVLNQTPSAFRQLSRVAESAGRPQELALRAVIFGGEALEPQSLRPWVRLCGDARPQLVNMYGITETTVHVTYRRIHAAEIEGGAGSVIGNALADLEVYVLDRRMQHVPVGVTGEMYVGGAGLARGYLRRGALTAERFVPNPFSAEPGARLYRTGDVARYRAGGDIEYLGRADNQVKVRGFRIELGEIESALATHPNVREGVVVAREDAPGERRLVAYVVAAGPPAPSVGELREHLKQSLPPHMIPAAFVMLDAIPLTPNGKLDRRALPAPGTTPLDDTQYTAPRNEAESLLAEIWQEVLGVDRVGIHDDYFALGGDSIRVVQVVQRAAACGLTLTVKDVFQAPTIAGLAGLIAGQRGAARGGSIPLHLVELPPDVRASLPADVEDAYPASKMQELMLERYAVGARGAGIYHAQQWFHLQAPTFSADALRRALQALVGRHPILRTVFLRRGDALFQAVKREVAVPLEEVDISGLDEARQELFVDAAIREDRATPFDADDPRAPLFRFKVFKRSEGRVVLLNSVHHAVDDGWGNVEFLKELFGLYREAEAGGEVSASAAVNSFKEFIAAEQELLASDEAKSFWRAQLEGESHRPLKRRASGVGQPAEAHACHLDLELTAALRALARSQKVSLKAVYASACLELVARVQGRETATVGVVSNGRSERLTEPLKSLGLFWNIVPVCAPAGARDRLALLARVQRLLLDIEPYAAYPLAQILKDQGKPELFFATLNFLHFHNAKQGFDLPGVRQLSGGGHDKFHFPLNYAVSLNPLGGRVTLKAQYDEAYFTAGQAREMMEDYIAILDGLARAAADDRQL